MITRCILNEVTLVSGYGTQTILGEQLDGYPRLFSDGDIYIYKIRNDAFRVWYGLESILPAGLLEVNSMTVAGLTNMVVIGPKNATDNISYYRESTSHGNWTTGVTISGGFIAVDSESDYDGLINVLTGNYHAGTESRIIRGEAAPPYSFSRSDTGIPITAIITDLEIPK